jgi:FkbH-like protein
MDFSVSTSQYMTMLREGRTCAINEDGRPEMRLAVMADHATQQLTLILKAAINEQGFFPAVYEAEYATAALEVYDDASALFAFKPEAVIFSIAVQKYRDRFFALDSATARESLPESYLAEVLGIVDKLLQSGIRVIVSNFALPIERMFGNYSVLTRQSLYGSVLSFNTLLAEAVSRRKACAINDVMYIANRVGADHFFDERLWLNAKYLCANGILPDIARAAARTLVAYRGKISKVLVLDLDNTLWGGVIGDDGLEGIQLGGNAEGEAFRLFQSHLMALKNRGYVLAVCSKNTEAFAIDAFRKHPEMVLREDDIALFVANWNDKASNIEYISRVLHLGTDSFVFIDDSPFERDLVKQALPGLNAPDISDDPAGYITAIEDSGLLETIAYSREDEVRNQNYREEAQRSTEQLKFGNIDDYLKSLGMKGDCRTFQREDLPRVGQLIQRSNQFNLRTQRLTEADCERYMLELESRVGLQVKLGDKFGDYGLISVICCDVRDEALFVTELVMSCRVLKRGVEAFIMNRLFDECRARGLTGVMGQYIETSKNGMVKSFYKNFGFRQIESEPGRETWFCPASEYETRHIHIRGVQDV